MKALLSIFLLISLFGVAQSSPIFPEDLLIDPAEYKFKALKVKSISQEYTSYYYSKKNHTTIDTFFLMSYKVSYDSLNRISSFKEDFCLEYRHLIFGGSHNGVSIIGFNDSSRIEQVIHEGDTSCYNYIETVYSYSPYSNELTGTTIIRPLRNGIIDGVYINDKPDKLREIKEEFEFGLIKKRSYIKDGQLEIERYFNYSKYENNGNSFYLLDKVVDEWKDGKRIYTITYNM